MTFKLTAHIEGELRRLAEAIYVNANKVQFTITTAPLGLVALPPAPLVSEMMPRVATAATPSFTSSGAVVSSTTSSSSSSSPSSRSSPPPVVPANSSSTTNKRQKREGCVECGHAKHTKEHINSCRFLNWVTHAPVADRGTRSSSTTQLQADRDRWQTVKDTWVLRLGDLPATAAQGESDGDEKEG